MDYLAKIKAILMENNGIVTGEDFKANRISSVYLT